jgi:toxin ParE1/3/4
MMRLFKRAAALFDLDAHAEIVQKQGAALALRFLDAADETMKQLARGPMLAGLWESDDPALKGIRVWPIRGFKNHLIFYRVQKDRLEIVRVLHAAQDIEKALHS